MGVARQCPSVSPAMMSQYIHRRRDRERLQNMRQITTSDQECGDRIRTTTEVLVTVLDVKVDLVADAGSLGGLDRLGAEEGRNGNEQEAQGEPTEDHGGRRGKRCVRRRPWTSPFADVATRSRALPVA